MPEQTLEALAAAVDALTSRVEELAGRITSSGDVGRLNELLQGLADRLDRSTNDASDRLDVLEEGEFSGDLSISGRMKATHPDGLHLDSGALRVHGTDIILDGRTGSDPAARHFGRALVDLGGTLAVNLAGDFANGVEVQSALKVDGALSAPQLAVGDVVMQPSDKDLHVQATTFRIHGTDLCLDGEVAPEEGRFGRAIVNEGQALVINFNGDFPDGVQIHSDLLMAGSGVNLGGAVLFGADNQLHVNSGFLHFHGTDLILDGRSGAGRPFRALVDTGNELVINFAGDYHKGAVVGSNLRVLGQVLPQGGDCAEEFALAPGASAAPGTVMVIGGNGALEPCAAAYDPRAAGVVSGAGGLEPAIILNREASGDRAVIALVGTVHCLCDGDHGAIATGDLLTTSATPGHAMRAGDHGRSRGAIIGKALGTLANGRGLVPILVVSQ